LVRLAGHRFAVKKAQVLLPAKCRCSSGHRCCVERGLTRTSRGAILGFARAHDGGTHLGFRSNTPPFAGRCGTRRPERWYALLSSGADHRVRAQSARGSASRRSSRTTKGVRGTRYEEGLRPPKRRREPSLDRFRSTWEACFFGSSSLAQARQPEPPRKGTAKGEGAERSSPRRAERGADAVRGRCPCLVVFAEIGRTPSGSKKRATCTGLVESHADAQERVNGSLTGGTRRTCKRSMVPPAKGGWSCGERRSSSRERRPLAGGYASLLGLRLGRAARSGCRWKASRIGEAHAFHEAPAEPVLAASGPTLDARRTASPSRREGGGDRDARGDRNRISRGGKTRLRRAPAERRSEGSVVKWSSPQPRSHRKAPSRPVHVSARLRTGDRGARVETFAGTSTEPQGFGKRVVLEGCRKASTGTPPRWEATKYECSSWNGFGVQRRSDASPVATPAGRSPANPTDTRDLARRKRRQAFDARGAAERERQRCAILQVFLPREWLEIRAMRDKPRRDRTRRGAGSGTREVPGPRAHGRRYDEGCPGRGSAPLNQGRPARPWPRG